MQKSRNGILLDGLQNIRAQEFAQIPDSLRDLEHKLQSDRVFYERLISEERAGSNNAEIIGRWQTKRFQTKEEWLRLVKVFELKYPKYYELKYKVEIPTLKTVEDHLNQHEIVLDYFEGLDSLYVFQIQIGQSKMVVLPLTYKNRIAVLRQAIEHQEYDDTVDNARAVYQILFGGTEKVLDQERWIGIPDGTLFNLPSQVLLTRTVEKTPGGLPGDL